ncbi:MAG: hypothetical protein LC104_11915 [Bacteroidales bacterium]|nr:hypothetical protein [Bacteroidales bacterium]
MGRSLETSTVRWSRRAVLLSMMAFTSAGCTPASLWWLARGNGKVAAEYPLPPKEGKEGITVLVLGSAPPTLPVEFVGIERDLAARIGRKMTDETKDDKKKKIQAIDQVKVDQFKSSHPDWKVLSPGQIGVQMGADYVIDVGLTAISLYSHDFGREVPQGKASLSVYVYDTADPERTYREYGHDVAPRGTDSPMLSAANYRRWFLDRIATEIAWKHIPHVYEKGLGIGR